MNLVWSSAICGRAQASMCPHVDQLVKVARPLLEMGCFARVETNGGGFEQVNLLFGENRIKQCASGTKPFHEAGIQTHVKTVL